MLSHYNNLAIKQGFKDNNQNRLKMDVSQPSIPYPIGTCIICTFFGEKCFSIKVVVVVLGLTTPSTKLN